MNKQAVNRAQVLRMCMRYLEDQPVVLWGQHWDLSDDDSLADCANWLTDIIFELREYNK